MGIIIRQSIKSSIASYLGVLLGYINIVLLFPYFFKPEEFGLTRVLLAVSMVFAQFGQLGVNYIILKYFPYYKDESQKHKGFLFFASIIPLAGFLLFSLVFLLFKEPILAAYSDKSPLFAGYYYWIFPLAFFIIFHNIFEVYSSSLMRIAVPALIREVMLRSFTLIAILLYYFGFLDFNQFLIVFVSGYLLAVLMIIGYIYKLQHLHIKPDFSHIDRSSAKRMIIYGLFSFLGGAAVVLVANIDTIMLGYLSGLKDTAVYTVAFFIGTVIQIPQRSISQISLPVVSDAWKNNDLAKIKELYQKTAVNQMLIGTLLLIGIWANIHNIMKMLPVAYHEGKYVILFIGLGKLFDMATGINQEIIITSRYYKFNLIAIISLIFLTITTNYIFIPIYGINGAAYATALSIFLFNIIKSLFVLMKFNMQPFTFNFLKIFLIGGIVLGLNYFIPVIDNLWIDLVIRSVIILIIYASGAFLLSISKDANTTAIAMLNKVRS